MSVIFRGKNSPAQTSAPTPQPPGITRPLLEQIKADRVRKQEERVQAAAVLARIDAELAELRKAQMYMEDHGEIDSLVTYFLSKKNMEGK